MLTATSRTSSPPQVAVKENPRPAGAGVGDPHRPGDSPPRQHQVHRPAAANMRHWGAEVGEDCGVRAAAFFQRVGQDREAGRVQVARRLGGPRTVCRVLSGQRYPHIERRQGLEWVVDCISQVLPAAREQDIVLGLENHYKDGFWKYPEFAQKMDLFLELVESIPDRDHFGVQYDPSNAIVAGDDPIALLRAVAPRVVSMHASDRSLAAGTTLDDLRQTDGTLGYSPDLRHGVTGKGLNDYNSIFRILAEHGYQGWVSIEDGMNGMDEMAESLAFLRRMSLQYFPD